MSQENVNVVAALYDAFKQADVQLALDCLDPAVEWHENARGGFDDLRPLYRGHAGVKTWWRQTSEPWDELWPEVREITDVGHDRVLCSYRLHARGRGGEVPVVSKEVHDLLTLDRGKVVERRLFPRRKEALDAVGLSE